MYRFGCSVEKDEDKYREMIEDAYEQVKDPRFLNDPFPEISLRLAGIRADQGRKDEAIELLKKAKRFKLSTFGIIIGVAVVSLFLLYNQCLEKVYGIEQRMKLEEQGDTYFYDTFGTEMSFCLKDILQEEQTRWQPEESTFYEKIRQYQETHPENEENENNE